MSCDVEITPEISEKILKLRTRARAEGLLSDIYDTDWNLYRWLLGWHMEVEKVESASCIECMI